MDPDLHQGKIVKWNDDRGFGFVQSEDGRPEVFLHISDIKHATRRPQVGDRVDYYQIADKDGRLRAEKVLIRGATHQSAAVNTDPHNKVRHRKPSRLILLPLRFILVASLPWFGALKLALTTANFVPIILYLVMSLLTFVLYANDKSRAQQGRWRIPENTLHLCELLGGWMGGWIAQQQLRHKSSKSSYQVVFWMIVLLHWIFWIDWLFLRGSLIQGLLGGLSR